MKPPSDAEHYFVLKKLTLDYQFVTRGEALVYVSSDAMVDAYSVYDVIGPLGTSVPIGMDYLLEQKQKEYK